MELIDRAARALYESRGKQKPWDVLHETYKEFWRKGVRTALLPEIESLSKRIAELEGLASAALDFLEIEINATTRDENAKSVAEAWIKESRSTLGER